VEELVKEPVEERPFRAVKDVLQKTGFSPGSTISSRCSALLCGTKREGGDTCSVRKVFPGVHVVVLTSFGACPSLR